MTATATKWCFTEHDVDGQDPHKWKTEKVKYVHWQLEEAPDTGKEHYQGFIVFNSKQRLSACKKISPTAHWETMKGTLSQNLSYCSKAESRTAGPWQVGELPEDSSGQRADIHELKRKIDEGIALEVIQEENPLYFDHRYVVMARNMQKAKVSRLAKERLEAKYSASSLRPWQQEAMDLLAVQNDREILWIADFEGETGKSFLTQFLSISFGYQILGSGKFQDLVHILEPSAAGFVFDLPASCKEEFMPYSLMEKIKDGAIVGTKYEGGVKMLLSNKVIVMSNIGPNPDAFKKNRLAVYSPKINLLTREITLKKLDGY